MKTYTIAIVSPSGWRSEVVRAVNAVEAIAQVRREEDTSVRITHTSKK